LLTEFTRLARAEEDLTDEGLGPESQIRREVLDLYRIWAKGLLRYTVCIVKDLDLAQEVVQETFLRYYECRLKKEPAPMSPGWIYRVARNYAIDRIRAERIGSYVDIGDAARIPDHRSSLESDFERCEAIRQIAALLAPRELECVQLRFEGFKYKEIAEILGIESGTVGAILARAFKKVQSLNLRNTNGHRNEVN
jgi:RNA polymerase sigma-70 factor, ECF subfamily